MAIVAVAGGSGPVGRSIVDGLVAHGGHKVFVISRSSRPAKDGVQYLVVDYNDIQGTSSSLETSQVDTVISAMGVVTAEASASQIQLVKAANKSSTTRRFVVSAYDMLHKREQVAHFPMAQYTFEAIDELDGTDLEYTRVVNGFFLDYYGMPHWKTHLHPWINFVNVEKKWAVIPGDGSAKANFITTQDMARFIARLMELDKWSKVSSIVADTLSISEVLEIAERVRGTNFNVVHDDLEKLKSGKISFIEKFPDIGASLDEAEKLFASIHYYAGTGAVLVPTEDALNSKFPDIVTKSAEDPRVSRNFSNSRLSTQVTLAIRRHKRSIGKDEKLAMPGGPGPCRVCKHTWADTLKMTILAAEKKAIEEATKSFWRKAATKAVAYAGAFAYAASSSSAASSKSK
ncbi:Oxidoreductase BOA1 [Colletotrichum orbiculare MAFF 240422]|uniref:Oxidoreductase BOA1 n=1 Tax=Colletotrichum orbiculare (strain 104-T / ATCC 96160 / CBS 514.97 / LARS 414 / MAFF 240422) TaxID=1213857 RepID=A0A484G2I1_COLOR|nr:Oxidoreductase BOA1 [Colletotrichum orbiculare MAFF 240422]